MADAHKNFAASLVATAPSPATSGTSLVVTAADGAKFPAAPFNATIWPVGVQPTGTNAEIVRVTAVSTDTLTIVRTQEGTLARTVIVGDQISANITAKTLTDAENPLSGVTGGTLSASTDFVAVDMLEVSATDTLEVPATSTLQIFAFPVGAAALSNASVIPDKLNTGAATAVVLTSETTTSSTFADLATPGPSVTVNIGVNGLALVSISCQHSNNTASDYSVMGFVASGANTIAASLDRSLFTQGTFDEAQSYTYLATGLLPGLTTFKAQYEIITGGTGAFARRYITVIPL